MKERLPSTAQDDLMSGPRTLALSVCVTRWMKAAVYWTGASEKGSLVFRVQ